MDKLLKGLSPDSLVEIFSLKNFFPEVCVRIVDFFFTRGMPQVGGKSPHTVANLDTGYESNTIILTASISKED